MQTKIPQILILQDLGVNYDLLLKHSKEAHIPHKILSINDELNVSKECVEVIVTIKEQVNESLLLQYPNVKLVAVAFTGYDAVDIPYCTQQNIKVVNVPAYATHSVAELTVGLTIALLRDITKTNQLVLQKGWNFAPGFDLNGKVIGIVGTGAIGVAVTKLFKAFGCAVYGWSRSLNHDFINAGGVYCSNLNELCARVDILSLHTPLQENTKNLISKAQMDLMKSTAYIINTARGPLINENDLINALENNKIAGAGLDVFETEPLPLSSKLIGTKNLILTPHIAYKTKEALSRRAEITIANIARFFKGNPINTIN